MVKECKLVWTGFLRPAGGPKWFGSSLTKVGVPRRIAIELIDDARIVVDHQGFFLTVQHIYRATLACGENQAKCDTSDRGGSITSCKKSCT